jgi:hypothetical protein
LRRWLNAPSSDCTAIYLFPVRRSGVPTGKIVTARADSARGILG